jgi:hypothetical protein
MPTTGVWKVAPHLPLRAASPDPPGVKTALIPRAWMTLYWQVPLPLQGGPHVKELPAAGAAVSTSAVLAGYRAEHPVSAGLPLVIRQLMTGLRPAWLVTLPFPVPTPPLMVILNGPLRNRASAVRLTDASVEQVPVPVQVRNHPRKAWDAFGVAVRVTFVPRVKAALHPLAAAAPFVMVQLMPAGLDLTVPSPVPLPSTVMVRVTTAAVASVSVICEESWQACSRARVTATTPVKAEPEDRRGERI